jgi:hypothetical protein
LIFFGSFLHQGKKEQSGEPEAQPLLFWLAVRKHPLNCSSGN